MSYYQTVDVLCVRSLGRDLGKVGEHLVRASPHVHSTVKHDPLPAKLDDDAAPTDILPSTEREDTNHFFFFSFYYFNNLNK